jgi:hypothetical protein
MTLVWGGGRTDFRFPVHTNFPCTPTPSPHFKMSLNYLTLYCCSVCLLLVTFLKLNYAHIQVRLEKKGLIFKHSYPNTLVFKQSYSKGLIIKHSYIETLLYSDTIVFKYSCIQALLYSKLLYSNSLTVKHSYIQTRIFRQLYSYILVLKHSCIQTLVY